MDLITKRNSFHERLDESDKKISETQEMINEFIKVNESLIEKTLSLDESYCAQMRKITRNEVMALKAMTIAIEIQQRLDFIETLLLADKSLEARELDLNKKRVSSHISNLEAIFLGEKNEI